MKIGEVEKSGKTIESAPLSPLDKIRGKYLVKKIRSTYLAQVDEKHDGALMFGKTFHFWVPGLIGAEVVNTGLTEEEERAFEQKLNLKPGSLSRYNTTEWAKYRFIIKKEGTKLNCDDNIKDKLTYKLMKAESETLMSKIAFSEEEASLNQFAEYIVYSEEKEATIKVNKLEIKQRAFRKLEELTLNDQLDFLDVFQEGKYKVSADSKVDFIRNAIMRIVDEKPDEFLTLLDNPYFKDMIFVRKLINKGIIMRNGPQYKTFDGEVLGNSLSETSMNMMKPEYNAIKISLATKLEAANK